MKLAAHTEALWKTREKIDSLSRKHNLVLFCIAPANYDYAVSVLGFRGSKKEFERILRGAIRGLSKNAEIQLHLHISVFPSWLNYSEQEKLFRESIMWFRKEGFPVKKVVFGWWQYDKNSESLAKKYGLEIIKKRDMPALHDYDSFSESNIIRAYLRMIKARLTNSRI